MRCDPWRTGGGRCGPWRSSGAVRSVEVEPVLSVEVELVQSVDELGR